jgi:hypothetical protein
VTVPAFRLVQFGTGPTWSCPVATQDQMFD